MRMRMFAAGLLGLASLCAGGDLLACGDKFLVVGRGTRFERAPAARQAAGILLYANPDSGLPETLQRMSVEATLRKAGYRPVSVASRVDFESALRRGGWDLVLVDLSDAPTVRADLKGDGAPVVLPVALGAARNVVAEARKQYVGVIASPTKGRTFVDAIDDALARKPRSRAAHAADGHR